MSRVLDRAILIADLAGYTALTEAHGDHHAADTIARYVELANASLAPGAELVERVGDEVLVVAPSAAPAIRSAMALRAAVEAEPSFPTLRAGLHWGSLVERDGRLYGGALNLASRIAGRARGGQLLCSLSLREAAGDLVGVRFEPRGTARFKNVSEASELFELVDPSEPLRDAVTDPVCRMRIAPESAPARLPFRGEIYFFCSFECARRFATDPESHVPSA